MLNPILYIKANIQYLRAVILANSMHVRTGKRYYIVSTTSRKLVVGDRKGLRDMDYQVRKQNKSFRHAKNLSVQRLEHCSFYYTPYADDTKGRILPHVRRAKYKECIKYIINK